MKYFNYSLFSKIGDPIQITLRKSYKTAKIGVRFLKHHLPKKTVFHIGTSLIITFLQRHPLKKRL